MDAHAQHAYTKNHTVVVLLQNQVESIGIPLMVLLASPKVKSVHSLGHS